MEKNFLLKLDRFLGLCSSLDGETEISDGESSLMNNFKITEGYKLKRRDGFTALFESDNLSPELRGIYVSEDRDEYYAVDGSNIYYSPSGFSDMSVCGSLSGSGAATFFPFCGRLFLLGGTEIRELSGGAVTTPEPYVPTVMISTAPSGAGTVFESVNLLTGKMCQLFSPDGTSTEYKLVFGGLDSVESVWLGETELDSSEYSCNLTAGTVTFTTAPTESVPDFVKIEFTKSEAALPELIRKCRYAMSYGGDNDTRAFLYGNPDYPAERFYSGIAGGMPDFTYFPVENRSVIGDGEPITAMLRHYDRQIIFTPSQAYYSLIEMKTDAFGMSYASFPVFTLSSDKGNISRGGAVIADNCPYTVCRDGIYRWVSSAVRDERNAKCVSDRISAQLTPERTENAFLFNRHNKKELFICCGDVLLIYNYALDVFYRYTGACVTRLFEDSAGQLYFATSDGKICSVGGDTDLGEPIKCEWYSKYFDFGAPERKKTLHSLTLSVNPNANTYGEISWATDKASHTGLDGSTRLVLGYTLFDFGELSFDGLSFDTAYVAKQLSLRLRVRRFVFFRVAIRSEREGDFHLLGILLKGRLT